MPTPDDYHTDESPELPASRSHPPPRSRACRERRGAAVRPPPARRGAACERACAAGAPPLPCLQTARRPRGPGDGVARCPAASELPGSALGPLDTLTRSPRVPRSLGEPAALRCGAAAFPATRLGATRLRLRRRGWGRGEGGARAGLGRAGPLDSGRGQRCDWCDGIKRGTRKGCFI